MSSVQTPTWLATCFAAQQAEHAWLRDLQQRQGKAFTLRGIPTRREEHWKYTDVSFLQQQAYTMNTVEQTKPTLQRLQQDSIHIVLVNGRFEESLSDRRLLPSSVVLCSIKQALRTHSDVLQQHFATERNLQRYPFASVNMALLSDGVFLYVPKDVVVSVPIHVHHVMIGQQDMVTCPRHLLIAEAHSQVTLLEEHSAQDAENYFTNVVTDIHIGPNAQIQYYKMQHDSVKATHIAHTFIHQQQNSAINLCHLTTGAKLSREDIAVNLAEPGATCSVNGFYAMQHDGQHVDNHVQIDHHVPHGTSDMIYKGILKQKSHAVYNGKIFVHPDAQKTRSNQVNHNLLLSPTAGVDTKPEFEIYADDVKCAHGATVGQLDTESLFYLRSRGIEESVALSLLTQAFATEVFDRITQPAIKAHMQALLNETLHDDN